MSQVLCVSAAPTIVISPAHCYFDETPEVQTLVPQYYKNATAQIGRCALPFDRTFTAVFSVRYRVWCLA